jgi:hypothetical protein
LVPRTASNRARSCGVQTITAPIDSESSLIQWIACQGEILTDWEMSISSAWRKIYHQYVYLTPLRVSYHLLHCTHHLEMTLNKATKKLPTIGPLQIMGESSAIMNPMDIHLMP